MVAEPGKMKPRLDSEISTTTRAPAASAAPQCDGAGTVTTSGCPADAPATEELACTTVTAKTKDAASRLAARLPILCPRSWLYPFLTFLEGKQQIAERKANRALTC